MILNYATLPPLMQKFGCKTVVDQIVAFVALHMQLRARRSFVVHLSCHGMQLRDMTALRTFMIEMAKVFKVVYPTELEACYVHGAPNIFASVYDLFKTILPKSSRDKIVIMKGGGAKNS